MKWMGRPMCNRTFPVTGCRIPHDLELIPVFSFNLNVIVGIGRWSNY